MSKPMKKTVAKIRFDGEKIIEMLEGDLEKSTTPITDFRTIEYGSEVLDGLFSVLIKEYLDRRDGYTSKGGGGSSKEDSLSEVVKKIKNRYTAYKPTIDKSRDACMGLFFDREHIGSGKYGDVYSASSPHDDDAGKRYAVKAILIHPFSHPMLYRNVVTEIEVGKAMGDIGVGPKVHDVHWCEKDGGLLVMIVSDLMTLGDLAKFSQDRAVTNDHVKSIRKQLRKMHKAGYIHNDIHARNVFVNAGINGSVDFYLGDFGFAKASKDSNAAKTELRGLGNLSRLVTRDRLRGILYKMVADGRVAVDIGLNTSSTSSSVWKDDVGYSSRDLL